MDVFTKAKRSEVMRAVKGAHTGPEIALRKALFALGLRYRLHAKELPGKPDLVFPKYRAVVFVHGCFWHGHDCARGARLPKTNRAYWAAKIAGNRARDKVHAKRLRALGWRVLSVWECRLKDPAAAASRLAAAVRAGGKPPQGLRGSPRARRKQEKSQKKLGKTDL